MTWFLLPVAMAHPLTNQVSHSLMDEVDLGLQVDSAESRNGEPEIRLRSLLLRGESEGERSGILDEGKLACPQFAGSMVLLERSREGRHGIRRR